MRRVRLAQRRSGDKVRAKRSAFEIKRSGCRRGEMKLVSEKRAKEPRKGWAHDRKTGRRTTKASCTHPPRAHPRVAPLHRLLRRHRGSEPTTRSEASLREMCLRECAPQTPTAANASAKRRHHPERHAKRGLLPNGCAQLDRPHEHVPRWERCSAERSRRKTIGKPNLALSPRLAERSHLL